MADAWVENEFATLDLGDARRNRRLKETIQAFCEKPNASIPEASRSMAETQGIYGLLESEKTDPERILAAHAAATVARIAECEEVRIVHDTSDLAFNTLRATEGLGRLSGEYSLGLKMHTAMAIDPVGVPRGLLHQELWARLEPVGTRHKRRARSIEEKESQRWVRTVEVCEARLPAHVRAWIIGDAESDIYEYLAVRRRVGIELLLRAAQNRKVRGGAAPLLWGAAAAAPVVGKLAVTLPRTRKRAERETELELRMCEVEIVRPRHKKKSCDVEAVTVSVVLAREVGAVPAGEKPVEWLLVSTKRLEGFEGAVSAVKAYVERWKVERFHYTLKSGTQVERLQLEYADRLIRAITLYSIVAWRLLSITYLARTSPDLPCTEVLEEDEWKALHLAANPRERLPERPPTVREAVRQIARLGGFLGRKGDGEPGVKVIWRGLRRLTDFVLLYRRLAPEM